MHKPPIAPKPKVVQPQRPLLSHSTVRKDGLSLPSPGAQRRVKPTLAPKPCLSKIGPAEPKPLTTQTLHQPPHRETQRADGPLYPQRDAHRDNKKPDWDYIIPICLCSNENCRCIRNASVNVHMEKDSKANGKTEDNAQLFPKIQRTFDSKVISLNLERNLNTDNGNGNVRRVPHRTWSDETNGNAEPRGEPGRGPEEERAAPPGPSAGPTKPVPVPRKPRMAALPRQEKEEEEREECALRDGAGVNVKEVKVLLEGKSISSPSAGAPVEKQPAPVSSGKACAIPDPPPRKKPLLSVPEKTSTSAPGTLPKEVEDDLGWASSPPTQVPPDKGAGEESSPLKPPMAWASSNDSSADDREKLREQEGRRSPKGDGIRAFLTPAAPKPSRSSLSKHKSKSFSAVDLVRSEGQRRNSFQKLLDLKLKMMPKFRTKAEQGPDGAADAPRRELHLPSVVVEQSVDGDEELYYENMSVYEEIADYINVEVGSAACGPLTPLRGSPSFLQPLAWQDPAYNDEGIYEEPDPYITLEKTDERRCLTPSDCERYAF